MAYYASFKAMELDGWQERAPHYRDRLGQVTRPATACLLDATNEYPFSLDCSFAQRNDYVEPACVCEDGLLHRREIRLVRILAR